MKHQTLGSIAKLAHATLKPNSASNLPVRAISIDTRTIDAGDVYVPIIGERLDGHQFTKMAFDKGAVAAFQDTAHVPSDQTQPYLVVEDTTEAFTRLATNYRDSLNLKMIGITGSNGKTTTKDIVHSVLSQKYRTKKTTGNLNNEIGVPRTLLQLDEDTEAAIVEMGMSARGEISHLTQMVKPDIAVITNVGDVHLEQLGSIENIAQAKLEILESMDEQGLFLYNYDNHVLREAVEARIATEGIRPRILTFGTSEKADHQLSLIRSTPAGTTFTLDGEKYTVDLLGGYQIYNACVAILIGRVCGLSDDAIRAGLHVSDLTPWRTELKHYKGFDMLVDVYKSNPPSLREALRTVALLYGYSRKIAILGDMLELGSNETELHRQVGREIDPNVFDYVLFYGSLSRAMMEGALENYDASRVFHFENKQDLIDQAKYLITPNTLVLLKGSRAMRLEEVMESLSIVTAKEREPVQRTPNA